MRPSFLVMLVLLPLIAAGEEAKPPPSGEVSFAAVGDVMLTRSVAITIDKHKDAGYPFARMRDRLKAHDIVFGNLENPITAGAPVKPHSMVFRADPGVEQAVRDAGFTILSLANNHLPDQREQGVKDTLAALEAVGIAHVGAGADDDVAGQPTLIEKNGLRFAFLAYADPTLVPRRYGAQPGHYGTNFIDRDRMVAAVAAVRPKVDVVIVSVHQGWEYRKANPHQMKFAHAAIDAGADLVIGHHPHVLQAVERYKGKFIAYSLGNFVFDQTFSNAVKEGAVLEARLTKQGLTSLRFVPYVLKRVGQPRLTQDPEILERIYARLAYPMSPEGVVDLGAK
jgi:poly-gamma-glutamate synthesis protein (capsule biosynthesis protein)